MELNQMFHIFLEKDFKKDQFFSKKKKKGAQGPRVKPVAISEAWSCL